VLCSNFVKFSRKEIGEIMRCLPNKKLNFDRLCSCRYCANRAQTLPKPAPPTVCPEFSRFHPNRFTFGRSSYSRKREHRQNAP